MAYIKWVIAVASLICVGGFEWMYSVFGVSVLNSDLNVGLLIATHMCLFSFFQLFAGAFIDRYGDKITMPAAALCVCVGMVLQICTDELNFIPMLPFSQSILTFGASFIFVGIGYVSNWYFSPANAGSVFGLAQMAYSLSYALFSWVAVVHRSFLSENFKAIIIGIAGIQAFCLILFLCTASNPKGYSHGLHNDRFIVSVLRHIYQVVLRKGVWEVSLLGGIAFGVFFSVAGFFLYKLGLDFSGLMSAYTWVGFAIGSPLVCWMLSFFKNKKRVMWAFCIAQCCTLLVMLLLLKLAASGFEMRHVKCLCSYMSFMFGVMSGGHMLSFAIGNELVRVGSITTFCAVVNGCMCVVSGIIILVLTFLSQFYDLVTLLVCMLLVALFLHGSMWFRLRVA